MNNLKVKPPAEKVAAASAGNRSSGGIHKNSNQDNNTADADFVSALDIGAFDGPVVLLNQVGTLIDADAPSWLVIAFIDCDDDWSSLAPAMRTASHILIAPDVRDISYAAGRLAAAGNHVIAVEWPLDQPWPAIEPRPSLLEPGGAA